MQQQIDQYTAEITAFSPANADELEAFRIRFLGTKGIIKDLFDQFKSTTPEEKRILGKVLNEFKQLAEARYNELKSATESTGSTAGTDEDLTLPGRGFETGTRHPLMLVRKQIVEIFKKLGFTVAEGPEIEDDWHNFSALNFAEEHPARDMQDTFFIRKGGENGDMALRTHTSSVQVRMMENGHPPFRAIMPGRVYRNEAISARAHCVFHQVEGLYVDKNVSFKDLKDTLYHFAKEMFGKDSKIRLRPSYFPFTEPSAEIDVSCFICKGKGCNVCKHTGWVEIAGSGMVDPNVLENCGIDSEEYTGFAFGMGIERITMLRYGINDLRLFTENDVRFLRQFEGA